MVEAKLLSAFGPSISEHERRPLVQEHETCASTPTQHHHPRPVLHVRHLLLSRSPWFHRSGSSYASAAGQSRAGQ